MLLCRKRIVDRSQPGPLFQVLQMAVNFSIDGQDGKPGDFILRVFDLGENRLVRKSVFDAEYQIVPQESNIETAVQLGVAKRWDLEPWDVVVKRIERVGNRWEGIYDEPDTRTEESMLVEQIDNTLHVWYGDRELAALNLV